MRPAGKAEASSAGEQLAKEYSAGTHRDDGAGRSDIFSRLWSRIGTIDSPCLKKLHLYGLWPRDRWLQAPLEILRRTILKRRMQATPVVVLLQELSDVQLQIRPVAIRAGVDFLLFQCSDKALAMSIVVRSAGPAHAGLDTVFFQQTNILAAGILRATIGMVH